MHRPLYTLSKWLLALALAVAVGLAVYNTSLNNYYHYGATTWDSAEFATAIWRSGWTLKMAPVFGENAPFFMFHSSPIQYIPNLFSYVFTGERVIYYALVYGIIYAALILSAYLLFTSVMPGVRGIFFATCFAIALFFSQVIADGSWELRIDYASPLFAVLAFFAYQLRKYKLAALGLVLNACVREDVGVVFAIPLFLLAVTQWHMLRAHEPQLARERLRLGMLLTAVSVATAVISCSAQHHFFDVFDQINSTYYSVSDPFAHLTSDMMKERASHLFFRKHGLWIPLLVLLGGATVFLDIRLTVGVIGFLPYLLAMILSKTELSGQLQSYKPFPLVLAMVWPALMALDMPRLLWKRYAVLQCLVLLCGLTHLSGGKLASLYFRWTPAPLTANVDRYQRFGEKLLDSLLPQSGTLRASHGIISLYPYQFPIWWDANIGMMRPEQEATLETIIWFEGDRDMKRVQEIISRGKFEQSMVPGTRILIARRVRDPNWVPDVRGFSIELLP